MPLGDGLGAAIERGSISEASGSQALSITANESTGTELTVAATLLIWHKLDRDVSRKLTLYTGCSKLMTVTRSSPGELKCTPEHARVWLYIIECSLWLLLAL